MAEFNADKHGCQAHWVRNLKIDRRSECDSKSFFISLCGWMDGWNILLGHSRTTSFFMAII